MSDKLYIINDRLGNTVERHLSETTFIDNVIKKGVNKYVGYEIKVYSVIDSMSVSGYIDRIKRNKNIESILGDDSDSKIDKFINIISKYDVVMDFLDTLSLLRFDVELKKIIKTNKMSLFYYVSNDVEWYEYLISIYNFNILAFKKKMVHIKNDNYHRYDPLTGKVKSDLDFELMERNFTTAYEKRNNC